MTRKTDHQKSKNKSDGAKLVQCMGYGHLNIMVRVDQAK